MRLILDLLNHLECGVRLDCRADALTGYQQKGIRHRVVPILARTSTGLPKHTTEFHKPVRVTVSHVTQMDSETRSYNRENGVEESLTGSASSLACPKK